MGEVAFLVVVGLILLTELIWTLGVVIRDAPGNRPTRELYDSRRPG